MKALKSAAAAVLAVAALSTVAAATAGPDATKHEGKADRKAAKDNLKMSWHVKQERLRARGLQMKLQGKVPGKVAKVANGQYVELSREDTDRVFVVIAEFGNTRHPAFLDTTAGGAPASDALTFDGPLHNAIPEPNRAVDNSTLWQDDYNRAPLREHVLQPDGGVLRAPVVRSVLGRRGRDRSGSRCRSTRPATAVTAAAASSATTRGSSFATRCRSRSQDQLAAGKTLAEVTDYLKTFDKWDRYDSDGDGNFDEPDGFIDHFQIVHAGGDQAAGDPQQGTDAIWSHRWYASLFGGGPHGFPGFDAGSGGGSGGLPGGGFAAVLPHNPTGVWVGDYTIQPENGGLGVFAHEYGHDLGLPDLYDTSGNTGGAENSTAFWTLMSSGANIGDGGPERHRRRPDRPGRLGEVPARLAGLPDLRGRDLLRRRKRGPEEGAQARPERRGYEEGAGRVRRAPEQAEGHGRRRLRRPARSSSGARWATTSTPR